MNAAAWADVYTQVFPAYQLLIESYSKAQDVVKTTKCWIHSANLPPRASLGGDYVYCMSKRQ